MLNGDQLGHLRTLLFFALRSFWVAFVLFLAIIHLYSEALSHNQFCSIWLNLKRKYMSRHFRINPATPIRSHIINKHQWPCSICSHTCPCSNTASIMVDRLCGSPKFPWEFPYTATKCKFNSWNQLQISVIAVICLEILRKQATAGHETAYHSNIQLLWGLWKWRDYM